MDFDAILIFLKENPYIVIAICVVFGSSALFYIVQRIKGKASNNNFLAKHPDAAKVYLASKTSITSEVTLVHTVNGGMPENFVDGLKQGFYLVPGQSEVEISYTYSRPGVMYKNVTESTDVVKKVLVVEANKSYRLGFDRKAEQFAFEEQGD